MDTTSATDSDEVVSALVASRKLFTVAAGTEKILLGDLVEFPVESISLVPGKSASFGSSRLVRGNSYREDNGGLICRCCFGSRWIAIIIVVGKYPTGECHRSGSQCRCV